MPHARSSLCSRGPPSTRAPGNFAEAEADNTKRDPPREGERGGSQEDCEANLARVNCHCWCQSPGR